MKCKDCLIWQRKRGEFDINWWWDECAKYDLGVLRELAKLIPIIREEWKRHELLRDTECPSGRCIL